MDPGRGPACPASAAMRLPRTRGDGPKSASYPGKRDRAWAPPHTRGWTRALDPSIRSCPDRAPPHTRGWTLLRSQVRRHTCVDGLPRTRGDGPGSLARKSWTRATSGSPAHAGMDPSGPSSAMRQRAASAPPHTRGWTRVSTATPCAPCHLGSPAHAGMDRMATAAACRCTGYTAPPHTRGWTSKPPKAPPCASLWGLPRTRGDGPCARIAARADCLIRLPRTRGDGPVPRCVFWLSVKPAPPHTRGWTRDAGRAWLTHVTSCGSPAHAGMDPGRTTRSTV